MTPKKTLALSRTEEVRRAVLGKLAKRHGYRAMAKRLGYGGPSYITQMVQGRRPISEGTARAIEEAYHLPEHYMDTPPGTIPPAAFANIDTALLSQVYLAVAEEVDRSGIKSISAVKIYEIARAVAEHSASVGRVDLDYIRRLIKLVG